MVLVKIMIEFNFKEDCSGCLACVNSCPVNAMKVIEDEEGFQFPKVDKSVCIKCGKCNIVCPHLNNEYVKGNKSDIKAVWLYASKNEQAKMKSSSGAACFELEKVMIEEDGYICGCIWDKELKAIHIVGNDLETLIKTQGSKYVQSNIGMTYREIFELLKSGKKVLFTGTPCQATAIHNYIFGIDNGKYRENLVTIAIICHGVASPKVWESYKIWEKEKNKSPLVNVNFRDKSKEGYKKSYCKYEYENGKIIYLPTFLPSSKYIEATLVYNLAMRNSCTHCDCKGINTGIDLIIGDWYAEYQGEGRLGTSCIVAFTERGYNFAKKKLKGLRNFSYEKVVEENGFIENSIKRAINRDKFFEKINDFHYWDKVEELYPTKYKYKKLLVRLGIYDFLKKFI